MKKSYISIFILTCVILFSSCKDKCQSGYGGGLTFKIKTMHHSAYIKGCTVKIKFDTQDFPGDNDNSYDIIRKINDTDSILLVPELKCGDYYLFATGYDSTINAVVKGGLPYHTSSEDGTIELIVPVTEPHP